MITKSFKTILVLFTITLIPFLFATAQWEEVDSADVNIIIPAGEKVSLQFEPWVDTLAVNTPEYAFGTWTQMAIDRAPDWLKLELADNFRRMDPMFHDYLAMYINSATDPYVDEICFIIAHTAPQTLCGPMNLEVINESIASMYMADNFLDYVEIVNYGDAYTGGDYYSTTRYLVEENGSITEYELPREIYYWYIVHTKLHKEVPNYIDPNTGNSAAPPTGVFWRDYLLNCADPGYPLLRDVLSTCEVLWRCEQNTVDNGAVGAVTQWIQDVMTFQSYPHHDQPVYIYHLHIGTCSVHSYLTSATARAALIPATVCVMYSDNHKINEFWERRWIAWEPVNTFIDNPLGYQGWGWDVAGVWNWRGDGYVRDDTELYTEVCTLQVHIRDNIGNPIDGAYVYMYSSPCVDTWTTAKWSDETGDVTFLLGDNRTFSGRVETLIGNYPAGGMTPVVSGTQAGAVYTWDVTIPGEMPQWSVIPDTLPASPTEDYKIVLDYTIPRTIIYGEHPDDGDYFSKSDSSGCMDVFICDQENYDSYLAGGEFQAFEISLWDTAGSIDFTFPTEDNWYAVFTNERSLVNSQEIDLTARLYRWSSGIVEGDDIAIPKEFVLGQNYPNPFNPTTVIRFDLPFQSNVKLEVFNILGQRVAALVDDVKPAGCRKVIWNGRSDQGMELASGVYIYKLRAEAVNGEGKFASIKKMMLIK
ncbi:MAG: T9SS type A sorting domain-containing protein [candidate division Zixibacteria bacterium]|nr:T9SS type A sorting domain-containing protein [Candidatus Tariuqbacter arcticus]